MNILLKNVLIVDPSSAFNGKKVDVRIEKGQISEIASSLKHDRNFKIVEGENLSVSPGWFDLQARFCDPGEEHKENLQSGMEAAAQGGFTGVCLMPSTNPTVSSKSQVEYLLRSSKNSIVDLYPAGSITNNLEGKDLSEMFDMKSAGAVAFTDDKQSLKDSGLFIRAMQYAENVGSFLMLHCEDKSLTVSGQMNEGTVSTRLGLKGIPALAEEVMVKRNISLMEYSGGKMHVLNVSAKGSIDAIRKAKSDRLPVSCSVAAHQLLLDDSLLSGFDSNYKVNPPLREKDEIENMKKAILNGVIDVISSDHTPEDIESKDLEFDLASFGISSLETAYACANTALGDRVSQLKLIESIAINPRKILGLTVPKIAVGEKANLTVFNSELNWTFETKKMKSKSRNSPFDQFKFKGKAIAVINNGICRIVD